MVIILLCAVIKILKRVLSAVVCNDIMYDSTANNPILLTVEEIAAAVRKRVRSSLKKMKSLPANVIKDSIEEEDDKQPHRLSATEL